MIGKYNNSGYRENVCFRSKRANVNNGKWVYMHNVTAFRDAIHVGCDAGAGRSRAHDCFRGGSNLSKFNIAR